VLGASPVFLTAFQDGPLPGFTGGFGERDCTTCHFGEKPNDSHGSVRISGVPAVYVPGQEYTIEVSLRRPGLTRGGFELASRFRGGAANGREAGSFVPPGDGRMKLIASTDGRQHYLQHTKDGTESATPGSIGWTFIWIAPDRAEGQVAFSVAANATNADASALGDFIYTTQATSRVVR